MLKKDHDRIKKAHKALIAREYQDLPLRVQIEEAIEEIVSAGVYKPSRFWIWGSAIVIFLVVLI